MRIHTERLILRPFADTDIEEVHQYAGDPDVCRYMVFGPNSLGESFEFLKMAISEIERVPCTNFHLAIVDRHSDQLIGACSLGDISLVNLDADLGYCLNKRHWNIGYATETAKGLIEYGFRKINLHRIHATCRPGNEASAKVSKSWHVNRGHLWEHRLVRGKWEDSILYSILVHEWNPKEKSIGIEE